MGSEEVHFAVFRLGGANALIIASEDKKVCAVKQSLTRVPDCQRYCSPANSFGHCQLILDIISLALVPHAQQHVLLPAFVGCCSEGGRPWPVAWHLPTFLRAVVP